MPWVFYEGYAGGVSTMAEDYYFSGNSYQKYLAFSCVLLEYCQGWYIPHKTHHETNLRLTSISITLPMMWTSPSETYKV